MSQNVPHRVIEAILRIDAELAQQKLDDACQLLWRVSAAPPNGETANEREAALTRAKRARENLTLALHRLNAFLCEGKVPENL